jgi:signal transduction histidine kinase
MKKINKSINKFNRMGFLFASLLVIVFVVLLLYNTYKDYIIDLQNIDNNYIKSQKEFIQKETKRALRFIQYKYNKGINNRSLNELQNEIIDAIEQMRNITNGTGYIFIYDFNGVNIADPILKHNNGKNLINFTDLNGKKVIKELINISKKQNGGYVQYVWNKPTTNTMSSKISYAKSFKPWNWMVGSGVYLDEIQNVLKIKKEQYKKKVKIYILQIISILFLLFISGLVFYRYFTSLLKQDIENIRRSLHNHDEINIDELTFEEFKQVAHHTNIMNINLKELNYNLEEKIYERTKELKQKEQFAHELVKSQDKFIKNAIHEINTPLSIIIANIDLFKLKVSQNKYLSKIEAGAKIIHNIYNDLSYLIKKDKINYTISKINFSQFLSYRIDFFDEIAIGNQINIKYDIADNLFVNLNDTQLQRICDNSLSNAIKYSYEDTTILITLNKINDNIVFVIQNKGDTILNLSNIFNRYFRENESRGGFGLGLNIIKEICDLYDIDIHISSKNNITVFTYTFKGLN